MGATRFEYRFRFLIHAVIYLLGFWSPWVYWGNIFGFTDKSTWLVLSSLLARTAHLRFDAATIGILVVALLFTGVGGWLRIWGTAYVSSGIVQSHTMHGETMLADGPYRRTRNPLYLGTLLHTIGIAILMPPSGAIFAVGLLWAFQIRLALAEEPFLAAKFGEPYREYAARVPRFIPSLSPRVPAAGATPHWLQAVLGELYFLGAFVVLAVFGWSFNADPMRQGILISLGVWLVVRAFLPKAKAATETAV
jgi:protein-S-isoprenylcysteine O-methyltransferase Ste14